MKRTLGLCVLASLATIVACGGGKPHVNEATLGTGNGWYCPDEAKDFHLCTRAEADCVSAHGADAKCKLWPHAICVSWTEAGKPTSACTWNAIECDRLATALKEKKKGEDVSMCETHK